MTTTDTKIELSILERTDLLSVFPAREGVITLNIFEDLKSKLKYTQPEIEEYEIDDCVFPDGKTGIKWNAKGVSSKKEFLFTKLEKDVLEKLFKKLDGEENFPYTLLEVYKKIGLKA